MSTITIAATDGSGSFEAFVARPSGNGPHGAIVLIQEIFGVNESIRETAQQFADMGFIVIAPDLFWRLRPGVDLTDKSEAEWKEALALMNAFDQDKGIEDLKATVAVARGMPGGNGRVGTLGYCLGGRLAMMMALRSDAEVNVSYYGVGLDSVLDGIEAVRTPLLLHIADQDEFFPSAGRAKVVAALQSHKHAHAYVYPDADHAFARIGGTHWQARAATIANGRSAEALVAALG
jgi:carboxymethylenebutenolidase